MSRYNDRVAQFIDAGTYDVSAIEWNFAGLGIAPNGLRKITDVLVNNDVIDYVVTKGPNGSTNWEVGRGAYNSTTKKIARTTILSSSNAGAAVDFGTVLASELLMTEIMSADQAIRHFTKSLYIYVATASQTIFTGADLRSNTLAFDPAEPNNVMVFVNGVFAVKGLTGDPGGIVKDYDLTGSNTITFASGLDVNSVIQILVL